METFETARSGSEGGPPPVPAEAPDRPEARASEVVARPTPHLRSTRGGAGWTAGATPKKAYRPATSKRPRPAGKKADTGPH